MTKQNSSNVDYFSLITYMIMVAISGFLLFFCADKDLAINTYLHNQGAIHGFVHHHWAWFTVSSLLIAFGFLVHAKKSKKELLFRTMLCLFVMVILYQLVWCYGIKFFWGRVRFNHLDSENPFTPFYLPQGISEHHSFPSGHTASIVVWLAPCWALLKSQKRILGVTLGIVSLICIALMAFSRISYGAHYPTDTLFSLFSGILFLPLAWFLTLRLSTRLYQP